ncbi:MAG: hypothetical protein ACFNL2_11735, partial [Tannerella forsythia]|uniref:hypothetical protein n=1 Tax=Tannerella forsythia TaxID=28112 RepID=UPI003617D712
SNQKVKASCASHAVATLADLKIRQLASLGQPDFLSPCSLLRRLSARGTWTNTVICVDSRHLRHLRSDSPT